MPRSFFRPIKTKKHNYCKGKKLIFYININIYIYIYITDGVFDNDLYTTGVLFEFDSNNNNKL